MVRTQIQITEEQAAGLRAISVARHQSVAALIRLSIESFLQSEAAGRKRERAKSAAGRYSSAVPDIGAEHDKYLAKSLGQS